MRGDDVCPENIKDIADQCDAADVPYYVECFDNLPRELPDTLEV